MSNDLVIMPENHYISLINIIRKILDIPEPITSDKITEKIDEIEIDEININTLIAKTFTTIDSTTEIVGDYVFYNCKQLIDVNLPNVKSIGKSAFYGCSSLSLTEVSYNTFPNLIEIKSSAFNGCSSIVKIDLPEIETLAGGGIFDGCSSLKYVNMPKLKKLSTYGEQMFSKCVALEEITLESLTSLFKFGFQYCTNLKTINFPSVIDTNAYTFRGCTSLENVYMPLVAIVSNSVFLNCKSLSILNFPSIKTIAANAFNSCETLQTLVLSNNEIICNLTSINAFSGTPIESGTGYIYVPSALIENYKSATNWSTFSEQFRAIEDYPDIIT